MLALHFALTLWLGWPEPASTRWWDERFNVRNQESILQSGRIQLANGYYGGVSYLPQTAVLALLQELHESTGWGQAILNEKGRLTATGYRVNRGSQALWGTATLLLLFLLCRRLVRPETAFLATVLMGISPRLHHASAIFKPDVELAAATLLALLLGWRAATQPPSTKLYLAAGAAIGLATGAKLNGVVVAFPLALATLLRFRETGRWPRLVLAGVASFLTFWFFNPDLARVLRSLERNQVHYENTATGTPWDVLQNILVYPFQNNFHGPWIAGLGILGVFLVLAWLVGSRSREDGEEVTNPFREDLRLGWWMLLSYPPVYYAVYAAASPRAKANHFLQVVPFVALFAALTLMILGHVLLRRGRGWGRPAFAALLVLVIVFPAHRAYRWIYEETVPTTWNQAQRWLEDQFSQPRRAFTIATLEHAVWSPHRRGPAYSMEEADSPSLDQFDGLIWPRTSTKALEENAAMAHWQAAGAVRGQFTPSWFQARGEALEAAAAPRVLIPRGHPTHLPVTLDAEGRLAISLPPEISPGTLLTVSIRLRQRHRTPPRPRLQSGEIFPLLAMGPTTRNRFFLTSQRFPAPESGPLLLQPGGRELSPDTKVELFLWERRDDS